MKQTLSIARKELAAYFGSPMALIFVGAFLAVTLFAFFWVDTFFARGIADARPLFRWMPVLLIFLVAALTMRQWSEEQRGGTLEVLLTLPVSKVQLVLGKFIAVMALVALALALTLFLPITVAILGPLDWGPVIGGYLAALLMAAAYAAIGLFVSSRTDNQLVALILTVIIGGAFYLIGSPGVTDFAPGALGDILRGLGAGSRFESIERGVIDLRDLIYYGSITGIFLTLNVLSVDRKRWGTGERTQKYRRGLILTSALVIANLILLNVWVYPLTMLRLDLTREGEYSLSGTTKDLLAGLSEPLTIRAYVSEKTHPLLAPLKPQLADLLREYEIAGRGQVTAEVIDPTTDPDAEVEANQTYGIQPSPFQVAGRYEASVINAYFDVLVRYGDQSEVLNFRDLIEVQANRDGTPDVRFRNLEYDLTRTVKRATSGFQSVDNLLASLPAETKLTLFATAGALPEQLRDAPATFEKVGQELAAKSGGKLTFNAVDPDAQGAAVTRQQLLEEYNLRPIQASLFDTETYYLDMILESTGADGQVQRQLVTPAGDLSEAGIRTAVEAALKRSSSGFLKVIGLWTPPELPTQNMFGQQQPPLRTWQELRQQLSRDYTVRDVDLSSGQAPSDIDALMIVSPQGLDDKAKFAVDQFLMRGGSVIVAAGNYSIAVDEMSGGLALNPVDGGLNDLLEHYGVTVEKSIVMDPQNEPFPSPVERQVGDVVVREMQALNYPFFVDVRPDAMDRANPITSKLNAVTLNWASPVKLDEAKNAGREASVLLESSPRSWLRTSLDVAPDLEQHPDLGFPMEGEQAARPLAVAVTGRFDSFFKGKANPLLQGAAPSEAGAPPEAAATPTPVAPTSGVLESSADGARLVVIGSGEFLTDVIFQVSSSLNADRYLNSLQLAQNAADWAVEDTDLLNIRARGTSTRVLDPIAAPQQRLVEFANYGLALLALILIAVFWNLRRKNEKPMTLVGEKR
ncbi:MAG: Gldg family protein [Anaerolineae bacterium]|nr:Gldg family protein [Anaerolineae bacterium]